MNAKEINNNSKADWVRSMTEDFYADEKKNPLNIGAIGVGNTIIVAYADNVDEPLIGVAKCNPNDCYDREVGIAIAYARAIGEDIPDYVLGTYEDEDEEDDWDEDEEDDWEEEEDWDEYEDKDHIKFSELGIGAKFIDSGSLYIKVDNDKVYSYQFKKVLKCEDNYLIDEIIKD